MSIHILLLDDDTAGATTVRDALRDDGAATYTVDWAKTCAEGLARLAADGNLAGEAHDGVAVVLISLQMVDTRGQRALDLVFAAAPQVPVLVVSAAITEPDARLAVKQGAQDYILRERLDGYTLRKTVQGIIERGAILSALFDEKERAEVTLNSIGDAVVCTDVACRVTYLNAVAERLTGWSLADAVGHPLDDVFLPLDSETKGAAPNPMALAIRDNKTVALTQNCVLVRRDGIESAIEDSAAPIHDRNGRVTGSVMVFRDVTKTRAQAQHMAYLAKHDSLTDLPNRSLLNERLVHALALAQRHQHQTAVLYVDVDNFKEINDTLGHTIGDRLLQSIADRLRSCVRGSDTVSRRGGDEFVLLLSELNCTADAEGVASMILRSMAAPHQVDQHEIRVTVSVGIAMYPEDGSDAESLLKHADFAMYHAKGSGRNNYKLFNSRLNTRAVARRALERSLQQALDQNHFTLYYQPTFHLATRKITGVEALIRWRHPNRGLILPDDFVPLAESCGLIVPIGRWALNEACRQGREWQDACLEPVRISVNVSPIELCEKGFAAGVQNILTATGFNARDLELELTETVLIHDPVATNAVLRSLKAMGVRLALDDFGTGFSSLTHLQRFPIDALKIDQSFIRDVTTDSSDASIVGAVISMAESLSMEVVAEGVETAGQLAFLLEQCCPEAQGFYLGRPMAADDITTLLRRAQWAEHP
jgi:diguanylate cyclase (GGDEF)-like protein/PAS domain S-box-containing protein